MIVVDSNVVIAGFASWHEHHAVVVKALARRPRLVAQAAVEAYSVLTRLPPPHRAQPEIVNAFLTPPEGRRMTCSSPSPPPSTAPPC